MNNNFNENDVTIEVLNDENVLFESDFSPYKLESYKEKSIAYQIENGINPIMVIDVDKIDVDFSHFNKDARIAIFNYMMNNNIFEYELLQTIDFFYYDSLESFNHDNFGNDTDNYYDDLSYFDYESEIIELENGDFILINK